MPSCLQNNLKPTKSNKRINIMTVRDFKNLLDEIEDDNLEIVIRTSDGRDYDTITEVEYVMPEENDDIFSEDDDMADTVVLVPTEFF